MSNEDRSTTTPCRRNWPPPPSDPFERFKYGPWPKSEKEQENAFIQFRRAADEQFRSFFSGFPRMFGAFPPDSPDMQARMEEMMQDMQKMRRSMEADEDDFRGRMKAKRDLRRYRDMTNRQAVLEQEQNLPNDPMQPWWLKGDAAKCPALKENTQRAKKCPAMYDEAGNPRTELDAYEGLESAKAQAANVPTKKSWSGLGWDGKLMQREVQKSKPGQTIEETQHLEAFGSPLAESNLQKWADLNTKNKVDTPWMWARTNSTAADPFIDHTATVPWLMTSQYSPVLLANPEMGKPALVRVNHQEGKPFQVSTDLHRFSKPTELEKDMSKLPWADAFEDLISLEQTGKMVERNYSTYRTPPTWIHDCVSRGSFGKTWGFNKDGMLTKRAIQPDAEAQVVAIEKSKPALPAPTTTIQNPRDVQPSDVAASVAGKLEELAQRAGIEKKDIMLDEEQIDKIANEAKKWAHELVTSLSIPVTEEAVEVQTEAMKDIIKSAFGLPSKNQQQAAEELRDLIAEANILDKSSGNKSEDTDIVSTADENISEKEQEVVADVPPPVNTTWTSNSTTWSTDFSDDGSRDSIVSTMTRTETRTLPDGSLETRRVLKRRFADGREQTEETVDVDDSTCRSSASRPSKQLPSPTVEKAIQTVTPVQDEIKKRKEQTTEKKAGWFWK